VDIAKLLKKRVIRNNGLYQLLIDEVGSGPLDGSCVALALALKEVIGEGELYSVWDKGIAQHTVLKIGNQYIDADGIRDESKFLKWQKDKEGYSSPTLRPFKNSDLPDSPRSKELVSKVVAYLNKEFKEGTMSKAKQFLSIAEELTDQERKEKINSMIDEFSKDPEIVDFVKKTEKSLATTQNHYGKYMSFLTPFSSKPVTLYIMSRALIGAGANAQGVGSALRVIKGE
jgi:hypothetical protein